MTFIPVFNCFTTEEGQFYGADDDGEIELTESGRGVLQQLDAMLEDGGEMPQTAATTNGHSAGLCGHCHNMLIC